MIRLKRLALENCKNVRRGEIHFPFGTFGADGCRSAIAGIYGQNGSGKTTVIDALEILKALLSGEELDLHAAECIAISGETAGMELEYELIYAEDSEPIHYSVVYRCELRRAQGGAAVAGESLAFRNLAERSALRTLFAWSEEAGGTDSARCQQLLVGVEPLTHWKALLSTDQAAYFDFLWAKRNACTRGASPVFSSDMKAALRGLLNAASPAEGRPPVSKAARKAYGEILLPLCRIVVETFSFASKSFAVITAKDHAATSLNLFRMAAHGRSDAADMNEYLIFDVSKPEQISEEKYRLLEQNLIEINRVLNSLVPGLSLRLEPLGDELGEGGERLRRVELLSVREGVEVPFRYESEGIKKILTILVRLIDVFANPGACVAIDELDAGVFEFLLGELLEVLDERGKGQLIFTAHNLRPLETLSHKSLVFTTTNPDKRYVTFKGHKKTHNLRDQYLRAINLGGQPETIYEPTSKYEIDDAFHTAGMGMRSMSAAPAGVEG